MTNVKEYAFVLDAEGKQLSPMRIEKAWYKIRHNQAKLINKYPMVVQLYKVVPEVEICKDEVRCGIDDGGEEKSTFADVLIPPYEEDFDTNIYIEYLLSVISERERYVIEEIFYNNRSQTQIASQIGVSQMQVSRIMRKALKKMKECA